MSNNVINDFLSAENDNSCSVQSTDISEAESSETFWAKSTIISTSPHFVNILISIL